MRLFFLHLKIREAIWIGIYIPCHPLKLFQAVIVAILTDNTSCTQVISYSNNDIRQFQVILIILRDRHQSTSGSHYISTDCTCRIAITIMVNSSNYSVLKVSPMAQRTIYCYGKSFVTSPTFADNSNVVIVTPVPFCQFHCSIDCFAEFYGITITIIIR